MVAKLNGSENAKLVTLSGMTEEQKKTAVYAGAGIVTGLAVFFVVRYFRKRRSAKK